MRGVFIELPVFARHRGEYLDDEGLRHLQVELLAKGDLDARERRLLKQMLKLELDARR